VMSPTNTALLLATEWDVVIKNIVLVDPDLKGLDKFHLSGELIIYLTVPASRAEDTR
jgi:hypothetical protein